MNKKFLACLMLASFLGMPLSSLAAVDPNTVPDLNKAINGIVTETEKGLNAQVGDYDKGAGAVAQFDWNSFNLGSNKSVNWAFTNVSQTALNRVLGNNVSQIYGKLTDSCATAGCGYDGSGKVILINPNGIIFGGGSQVNLNSFTASTFDATGAKNLKDLTTSELTTYKNNLNSNFGPGININFSGTAQKVGALIKLDGTNFNIDKSLVIMAKDVEIENGSVVATNLQYNYGTGTNQSFSNVKIFAGNGAQVKYQANGYVNNSDAIANAGLTGVTNTITIKDKDCQGNKNLISSGNVYIKNAGVTNTSNISISDTNIDSVKLVNKALGDVMIAGNAYVDIKDSKIETYNSHETNNTSKNTHSENGGQITIYGKKGITVDNSTIKSAYSSVENNGGDILLSSAEGSVDVKNNSTVFSRGKIDIEALNKVNITDSSVTARNRDTNQLTGANINLKKNINITGAEEVNIKGSTVDASGDVSIASNKKINVTGNGGYNSALYAGGNLNLHATDTLIQDTNASYNNLSLYKTGQINNVTIKGATTLEDRGHTGLNLVASGNLTVDNNKLQKLAMTYDSTKGLQYGATANQSAVTLTSNTGNVSFINNSNVTTTTGDINATAAQGSINVLDSSLKSAKDINLTALNSFVVGTNINANSAMDAKNINITMTGANSDIILDQPVVDKLKYTGRLKLDAGRDNKITSTSNVTLNKVDMIAGRNNEITASNNVTLTDVTMKAVKNNVTATNGSISLDTVSLLAKNTAKPEDTITTLTAKGDIKTVAGKNLATNQTKLIANAQKDVDLRLTGTNNYNAGVEVSGKIVKLDAVDAANTLSISRIVADRLTLNGNNKFIAAKTTLTSSDTAGLDQPATEAPTQPGGNASGRAYIEVREYNGFNLDNVPSSINENGEYQGFYTASYKPGSFVDDKGETVSGYTKHFINLQGANGDEKFLLVYNKPVATCVVPPIVNPDDTAVPEDYILRLPVQSVLNGRPEPITNNLTDVTSTVVAAAAGISLADEENENEDELSISYKK